MKTLSHTAYTPKVYSDYVKFNSDYDDISVLDTPTFFFGMRRGESIHVTIEKGKNAHYQINSCERSG